jgi:hypothetical protein
MANPSHILIARNSRGPNNPSASLSSPTETHAAASGIFRSSGSPPWLLEECETDDIVSELSIEDDDEAIELDETFVKNSAFPGTVKIVVESTTFWSVQFRPCHSPSKQRARAHKEVLFFASPFFEAALSGNWAETGRPPSMSSIITISQPPSNPGDRSNHEAPTEMTFAPMDPDNNTEDCDTSKEGGDSGPASEGEGSDTEVVKQEAKAQAIDESLAKLQSRSRSSTNASRVKVAPAQAMIKRSVKEGPDAVIVLKEERVCCRPSSSCAGFNTIFRLAPFTIF